MTDTIVHRSRALSAATLLAATLVASSAGAGETESRSLFAEARVLRTKGQCSDAIPLFKKALETYPEGLGALRNVAECEEELKRYASARRSYWDLRLAVLKLGSPKYQSWDKDAEQAHARLDAKVARVVVRVKGDPAWVRINGVPMDPRLVGIPLEQDLGSIEVSFQDGSSSPPTKRLMLEEGKRYEIDLESSAVLPVDPKPGIPPADPKSNDPLPKAPPKVPPPEDDPPPPSSGPSPLLIGGAVSLGVGGASAIAFFVSLGIRQSALGTIEDICPNLSACEASPTQRQDIADAADRGGTASTLATVFAIVGGVGVAAGTGMLIGEAVSSPSDPKAAMFVAPTEGGAMFFVKGDL